MVKTETMSKIEFEAVYEDWEYFDCNVYDIKEVSRQKISVYTLDELRRILREHCNDATHVQLYIDGIFVGTYEIWDDYFTFEVSWDNIKENRDKIVKAVDMLYVFLNRG